MLRHRGHRYITTREFERAIVDLERAAARIRGVPDEVEPDGMPNAQNKPRSTSHTNIFYHLGLAYYLIGDYDRALGAYEQCLEFVTNDDMLVATVYWTYLCLDRLAEQQRARALLARITPAMDVIENDAYHKLLLLYKGVVGPEDVIGGDGEDEIQNATAAYGVASWYRMQGDDARAEELFQRLVDGAAWPAFGTIAAEAEVARVQTAAGDQRR
jgi:tetratricopeptide (TPR) repeat protein